MAKSARKFSELLTEAIYRIKARESKTISAIQDELGYAVGFEGGGDMIEHWRKPANQSIPKPEQGEILAQELTRRGGMEDKWLETFLNSIGLKSIDSLNLAPFVVGPPIGHPQQFFGRHSEIQSIFNLWQRYPLQHVAVVGAKRSGKTSLLHYLRKITTTPLSDLRSNQSANWLTNPEQYRWIYVDFQDPRMSKQESLLCYLLESLELPVPSPCDLGNFLTTVNDQIRSPTIVMMDEIGAALASPEFDMRFWWGLRSWGNTQANGKLAFLLTAHELPEQLAIDHGKPSPFFNIFGHTIDMEPLQENEARELIAHSPIPFAPTDVEWILSKSGRWPCLLQILCHARLESRHRKELNERWKEQGCRQMSKFRYLLDSE